jgi:hypothetical protein
VKTSLAAQALLTTQIPLVSKHNLSASLHKAPKERARYATLQTTSLVQQALCVLTSLVMELTSALKTFVQLL